MKRPISRRLEPATARKKIASAKSNKPFMAALLDRDHRGHNDAVEQWSRLHEAAFPERDSSGSNRLEQVGNEDSGRIHGIGVEGSRRTEEFRSRTVVGRKARPFKSRHQSASGSAQRQPSAVGSNTPPVINLEADRIQVILDDRPALFEIADNPNADGRSKDNESLEAGLFAVLRHADTIEREAARQGVDPDLVKAIVYMENAHDATGQRLADFFGRSTSVLPMNIQPETWAGLGAGPIDFHDPEMNIRAGVTLIRRIIDRVDDPTTAKVASIWNFTGRELVNDFGARAQAVYDNAQWRTPVPSRQRHQLFRDR